MSYREWIILNRTKIDYGDSLQSGILTIGNEVLDGLVMDTNSNWIEKRLTSLTIPIIRQVTVRDEMAEIRAGLEFLLQRCNLIITSGGLGPTYDDMTIPAIASALNLTLHQDDDALEIVRRRYQELNEEGIVDNPDLTKSRKKMAFIPKGSQPLNNDVGGAPGVKIKTDSITIFCLPGVPGELKSIWKESLEPWLKDRVPENYSELVVEFALMDETVFAPHSRAVMDEMENIWIKSMPKQYGTTNMLRVWISSRAQDSSIAKDNVQRALEALEKGLSLESTRVES